MSVSSTVSPDAAARTLVLRHIRTLITKTLAFFGQRQDEHLKILRAHLFELVDARPNATQAQNLRTAGIMLDRQADLFNRSFQGALRASIEEELESVLPGALLALRPPCGPDEASGPASMALLDIDEIERHLLVDRVAQRFNARYDAKLVLLTQALGVLLRLDDFSLSDNPFRPAILVRAFSVAWQLGGFDPEAAEDFVLALDPRHSIDWSPLYADLTETLVRAGFSAQVVHRIKRAGAGDSSLAPLQPGGDGSDAAKSGFGALAQTGPSSGFANLEPQHAAPAGGDPASAPGRGIAMRARQFLQKLGFGQQAAGERSGCAGSTGGTGGPIGTPGANHHAPTDAAFMGYLGGLQAGAGTSPVQPWVQGQNLGDQNLLRQMRDSEEVKRAPELDRGTVDALAEVFDYVFADKAIPTQLKVVIGRLQIPVLKAAMIDRDFFLSSQHPARQLVDALASAALGWMPEKGESDPLYVCIETTVKRVLTEFEDDLTLFGTLVAQLTAFLVATEQQAQSRIEHATDQAKNSEAVELALAHVDEVVHQCINALPPAEPLVPFLLPFLTNQWREVMARAWIHVGQMPADWDNAVSTMDQVIWSSQPKTHANDRSRLVALLPDLVRRLNTSLDVIAWVGEQRAAFTRRLIATHMKAIRPAKPGPASVDSMPGELETSAGRDAMQALDERRARQTTGHADDFDAMAKRFARGEWFEFAQDRGAPLRYRLSWVSPQRTRLLFTNRDGFDAFVRSEREVASLLREGRLTLIAQEPIVARAIDRIMASPGQAHMDLELV